MAGALGTDYDPSFPAMGGGMKKRSRENQVKARPCKALLAKGRSTPKAIPSVPHDRTEMDRLTREHMKPWSQQASGFRQRWQGESLRVKPDHLCHGESAARPHW
jgi:hypothetical protein